MPEFQIQKDFRELDADLGELAIEELRKWAKRLAIPCGDDVSQEKLIQLLVRVFGVIPLLFFFAYLDSFQRVCAGKGYSASNVLGQA